MDCILSLLVLQYSVTINYFSHHVAVKIHQDLTITEDLIYPYLFYFGHHVIFNNAGVKDLV